jgi:four helix bundle protein
MGVSGGDHKDLRAYQLARSLSRRLWAEASTWRWFEQRSVGLQLVRSADSVGANIAEATGRWHRPDQMRLLLIARGSLHELEHWIALAQERGLLASDAGDQLPELARTLSRLIRKRRI